MSLSKFFHFFPIPSFLRMQAAGLSLSDSHVRFIEIEESEGVMAISKFGLVELPPKIMAAGDIVDKEAFVTAVSKIHSEHGIGFVKVALPDDKVYVFRVHLPPLPYKEIRSSLEFKIDENIPISAAEAIYDYEIINNDPTRGIDVVVSAISRESSVAYSDTIKKAGLQPMRFGLESQSIANAVVPESEKGTVLVVSFCSHKTGISIVENNVVQFSLTVRSDEIPSENAVVPKNMSAIKQEIDRVLHYWSEQISIPVGELKMTVIASGIDVLKPGFVEDFSSTLGREVKVADPWCNVSFDKRHAPPLSKEESYHYAAAIGAAIAHHSMHSNV